MAVNLFPAFNRRTRYKCFVPLSLPFIFVSLLEPSALYGRYFITEEKIDSCEAGKVVLKVQ